MPIIGVSGAGGVAGAAVEPILLTDEKADNVDGGTFTSGAWQTRTLNTKQNDPGGYCALAGNAFTLEPGKYWISWSCPAYLVNNHQSRLYDVTGSAVVKYGSSEYAQAATPMTTRSHGAGYVDIAASNDYRIEHRSAATRATDGFGLAANFGNVEEYTIVEILRLGAPS